jgi:hypothetical protein
MRRQAVLAVNTLQQKQITGKKNSPVIFPWIKNQEMTG